jgi:hypothetical protein
MTHVKTVTQLAADYGLKLALLPTWGDKWNEHSNSAGPSIFDTPERAHQFGRDVSDALADCPNIIWIMGGDSPVQHQHHANIVRAMAHGIRAGGSGDRLMGFHPQRSSEIFHSEDWLDFNAIQTGHCTLDIPAHYHITRLRDVAPTKPCLPIEPNFEGMDLCLLRAEPNQLPFAPTFNDYDVRKINYRTALAGAAGFSYGHESIRKLYRDGDQRHRPFEGDFQTWDQALDAPGAFQLSHFLQLLRQRDCFNLIPAQECFCFEGIELMSDFKFDKAPLNTDYFRPDASAAISCNNEFIIIYTPRRQVLQLDTTRLCSKKLQVSTYNPENGERLQSYVIQNTGIHRMVPQRNLDTLYILDNGVSTLL